MSQPRVRCANCGKRIHQSVRICPACGAEQPLHLERMRCNYCSRRIPSRLPHCPYCGHNPRGFYLRPRLLFYLAALAVVGLLIYAGVNTPVWLAGLAVVSTPTPTPAATHEPTVVVIVVTQTPAGAAKPSPTFTSLPVLASNNTSSSSNTNSTSRTDTPTVARTLTLAPTLTPTRRPRTLVPTPTLTPTPMSAGLPVALLVSPVNGQVISGRNRGISLAFQSSSPLGPNQWFRVEVIFHDRENRVGSWCGWTRDTQIVFPSGYFDDTYPFDRTFRWHVNVAVSNEPLPSTCTAPTVDPGIQSAEWTFQWF